MICFTAALHRYDLLNFADTMASAFEVDEPDFDPIPILRDLEILVTARLRHASSTWVQKSIELIAWAGISFSVTATALIFGRSSSVEEVMSYSYGMVISLGVCGFAGWPLASVAETFEYDVLRWLNNVSVLNHAMKRLGPQTL